MKLDITQILNGKSKTLECPLSLDPGIAGLAEYLPEDVRILEGVGGTVSVSHRGEYISVTVTPETVVSVPCARCLSPVRVTVSPTFERIVPAGGSFNFDGEVYDEEEILTVVEGHVDLTWDVCQETALAMPDFILCDENCPGLCQKCGKALKDGPCGCTVTKEIDPRMKIFEKLLEDME